LRHRLHPRIRTYGSTVDIFAFKGNINVRMRRMCRHDPERGNEEEIKYKSFSFCLSIGVVVAGLQDVSVATFIISHLVLLDSLEVYIYSSRRERRAGSFILSRSLDSTCSRIHSLIAVGTAMNLPGVLYINVAE
jgi:hypothetical protein